MAHGRLHNKVAFITGGAAGIGAACAKALAAEGAAVAISDLNDAAGEATVAAINAAGGRADTRATRTRAAHHVGRHERLGAPFALHPGPLPLPSPPSTHHQAGRPAALHRRALEQSNSRGPTPLNNCFEFMAFPRSSRGRTRHEFGRCYW